MKFSRLNIIEPKWVSILLLIFCFSIMFWIEADSYTHDLFCRGDTAWFMAAGRALAEGQVPYVDFADSKGLLLWWIYALGYWICDYNYVGVFWISVLFSWGTFWWSYQSACLLCNDKKVAFIATLLMAFPYYNCLIQGRYMEFRCEDFCLLFISYGLYVLISCVKDYTLLRKYSYGIFLGVGWIACIMIKWTIGVMYLGIVASYFILMLRHRQYRGFLGFIVGVFLAMIPFIVAFAYYGNFSAFVKEYFLNTAKTVSQPLPVMLKEYLLVELKRLFISQSLISLVWIVVGFVYAHKKGFSFLPILSGLFILLLAAKHDLGYYTIVVAPFAIFACVWAAQWFFQRCAFVHTHPYLCLMLWYIFNTIPNFIRNEGMWYNSDRELYYKTAYMIGQIGGAKIINDSFYGDPVGGLAGSKYWMPQFGETKEMAAVRAHDIKDGKADFVFGDVDTIIDKCRYQNYLIMDKKGKSISFWGRKGLHYPPKNFQVSDMDILLKRRVIDGVR